MAVKKCALCNQSILKTDEAVPYKNGRFVHSSCFNIAMKTIKKEKDKELEEKKKTSKTKSKATPKPKPELKDAMSEEEYQEKKQYYDYLRTLIDGEMTTKIYALTEDYIKKYDFTFLSMYRTLVYLHEIVEKDLIGDVVGIIPYYHSEAQNYYQSIEQVEDKNKDIDTSKMYKEKVIYIKPKQRINKQIDIMSIGKEE